MIIENCSITGGKSALITKEYVDDRSDPLYKVYGGYHDGVDLAGQDVYSFCSGKVVRVGRNSRGYTVTVECGESQCVAYAYLKSVSVKVNDELSTGDRIGLSSKTIHFEYISDQTSIWPVRIVDQTLYKNNPMPLLQQGSSYFTQYGQDTYQDYIAYQDSYHLYTYIPDSVAAEFTNNTGR